MESGPLSEWVAAFAELAAVVVALFLPYYNAYKEKKHTERYLRLVLKTMVTAALNGEPDSIKTLDLFLKITLLKNTDSANDKLLLVGNQIVEILNDDKSDKAVKQQKVIKLMGQLDIEMGPLDKERA